MNNKIRTGLIIASLFLLPAGLLAASNKCEVVEVDGNKLILECERDNAELKAGDQVKLKTVRSSSAAIEGC